MLKYYFGYIQLNEVLLKWISPASFSFFWNVAIRKSKIPHDAYIIILLGCAALQDSGLLSSWSLLFCRGHISTLHQLGSRLFSMGPLFSPCPSSIFNSMHTDCYSPIFTKMFLGFLFPCQLVSHLSGLLFNIRHVQGGMAVGVSVLSPFQQNFSTVSYILSFSSSLS